MFILLYPCFYGKHYGEEIIYTLLFLLCKSFLVILKHIQKLDFTKDEKQHYNYSCKIIFIIQRTTLMF